MKILVIGSGGREDAIAWRLAQDEEKHEIVICPGNAGTERWGRNVAGDPLEIAINLHPDLVVIGPEAPLVEGLTDRLEAEGITVFGPSRAAAQLEGSKAFSKEVMAEGKIPTARYVRAEDLETALAAVRSMGAPVVVKADGLAAGKGVAVCATLAEAEEAVRAAMEEHAFGAAGNVLVIEEFLEGEEASILAVCDGSDENYFLLPSSQDHKRVFDEDKGPNTGGMGAYSPAPVVTSAVLARIEEEIIRPTLRVMKKRGAPYKGILYAGLMITAEGPKVIEFNCRFGDPEAECVLPRVKGSFGHLLLGAAEGRLDPAAVSVEENACVSVVMASKGYPGLYEKGKVISGLDEAGAMENVAIFHAGTRREKEQEKILTNGGRVLNVVAKGKDIPSAIKRAYQAVERISFEGAFTRSDIGQKALKHLG